MEQKFNLKRDIYLWLMYFDELVLNALKFNK